MSNIYLLRQHNSNRFLALLCTLIVAGCLDPDASTEAVTGTFAVATLDGRRVIRFPQKRPEINRELILGIRSDGGECQFQKFVRLGKGQAFFQSVAEYNPDTCEFVIAHHPPSSAPPGHPRPPAPDPTRLISGSHLTSIPSGTVQSDGSDQIYKEAWNPDVQGGPFSSDTPRRSDGSTLELECPVELGNTAGGSQRLWHEDPPGLDVTEHQLDTWFFYHDGECVQYINAVSRTDWLGLSGWHLETHSLNIHPYDPQWNRVDATAYSSMENPIFCAFNNTWVFYSPNQLRHFDDGYVGFWWNYYATGGCSSWLTPHWYGQTF